MNQNHPAFLFWYQFSTCLQETAPLRAFQKKNPSNCSWASDLQRGTIRVWPGHGSFQPPGRRRRSHPVLWPRGSAARVKRISLWEPVKYRTIVSVHLGMSGGSRGQSPPLQQREGPPVWRGALRRCPPAYPSPTVAGGVRQHAAGPREVPALPGGRRGHVGEHGRPQSGCDGELA